MRSFLLPVLLGLFLALGCEATDEEKSPELFGPMKVSGTVTYYQRIALPPDAVVRVSLVESTHSGAPGVLVNETTITSPPTIPIPFEVWYRRDTIDPTHIYGIKASIQVDGKPWFQNTKAVQVINNHVVQDVEVVLEMVQH